MQSRFRAVALAWLMLLVALAPGAASATVVDLRRGTCTTTLDGAPTERAVTGARYRCGIDQPSHGDGWLWLRLDAARLREMPAHWNLLVDQTRFDRIAILTVTDSGSMLRDRSATALGKDWALGGVLRFPIAPVGSDIKALYVGFERIDDLSLMRKVVAISDAALVDGNNGWLLLMGMFAGTLLSALLYNAVIHTGHRLAFQRWYLLWVGVALAYGLVWTNMAAFAVPALVGPLAVRVDFVLVGLMVAAGNMFLFAVIEEGVLPRAMIRVGHTLAGAGAVLGCIAAADHAFPPVLTDRLLNYVIALTAVTAAVSSAIAVRRGSRVIWFYLIGWSPVISVFVARLTRNLGLVAQDDRVDMATFATLAFEALVLSLAIADRFRLIRQAMERARQRHEIDEAEAKALRFAAHTDFLTGLGNRAAFQDHAQRLIAARTPFDLFLVDVDYLKEVNDRLGHAAGDALLQTIGAALSARTQAVPDARVTRIGGDEFAILCPGPLRVATTLIETITAIQGESWSFADQPSTISLSIGSSRYPEDAQAIDLLFQNADLALYTAKRIGRARHCRYDPLQRSLRELRTEFAGDAETAMDQGEFELHFQPIVSLTDATVEGHEALLRWNHPVHGLMSPARFADVLVAERIGLRIQEHVLELALTQLRDHGARLGVVSVNFTSAQLSGPRAARRVLDRIAHYGVPATSLCVEVTEGVMLDRAADSILANLKALHDAGIGIALDDFGTGYASLVHLRRLPVDRIKIDQSFIAGIDQLSGGTTAIVRAIVGLGRGLGKCVVAEGIETESQALALKRLGCQLGQGFLYGRPEPLPLPFSSLESALEYPQLPGRSAIVD